MKQDTAIIPFVCRRCLQEAVRFSRTGGVPNMQIRVVCMLTGYTAVADVQGRRIARWEVYGPPVGWLPPKKRHCRKESRT